MVGTVGVVGLGSMGYGVARACLSHGFDVYGVDVRSEICERLRGAGAVDAGAAAAPFAASLDAAILLVVDAAQCEAALFGPEGLAAGLRPGTPVMVSATISPDAAAGFARRLGEAGIPMLDAPVSGGAAKAAEGKLTVMAAGAPETFDRLAPLLDAIAETVYRVGSEPGQGATVKIVHQLLAGVHIAAAAEAMALAARAGIPLELMYQIVTHSAGNSWMFENRMRHVVEGDYEPRSAVDIFVKDLGLVNETGRRLRFPLPLAAAAYALFANASNLGLGRLDDSAVIRTFAGIDLPGVGRD